MVARRRRIANTIDIKSIENKLFRCTKPIKIISRSNNISSIKIQNLKATFKVVKNSKTNVTDAVVKTRVIAAINQFFALDNWDFGDTFYFTELAAFIHNSLAPDVLTAVIVPNQSGQGFGSMFQIDSASDEIFISGATVNDVSIITALGANQLSASGTVVTNTSTSTASTSTGSAVSGSTTTGSSSSTGSSGAGY